MKIKFSRHAKRRTKLYKIPEGTVVTMLENCNLPEGEHEIVRDVAGFRYPVKVVIAIESNVCTIVASSPLKKAKKP